MEKVDSMFLELYASCEGLHEADTIISDVRKLKGGIYDIVTKAYPKEELQEKYPFPVILNEDNAVLYARELRESSKFYMVILKHGSLTAGVVEYNISAQTMKGTSA